MMCPLRTSLFLPVVTQLYVDRSERALRALAAAAAGDGLLSVWSQFSKRREAGRRRRLKLGVEDDDRAGDGECNGRNQRNVIHRPLVPDAGGPEVDQDDSKAIQRVVNHGTDECDLHWNYK